MVYIPARRLAHAGNLGKIPEDREPISCSDGSDNGAREGGRGGRSDVVRCCAEDLLSLCATPENKIHVFATDRTAKTRPFQSGRLVGRVLRALGAVVTS